MTPAAVRFQALKSTVKLDAPRYIHTHLTHTSRVKMIPTIIIRLISSLELKSDKCYWMAIILLLEDYFWCDSDLRTFG